MAKYQSFRFDFKFDTRLVLVGLGKTGKSSAGNTILGENLFGSNTSSVSKTKEVLGHCVSVVDTPGLSSMSKKNLKAELVKAIDLSSPGPHAFLLIIPIQRFIEVQHKELKTIKKMLSADVSEHTIVLFTFGDKLDTDIKEFISDNHELQKLLRKCRGQYHVFNNKDTDNREQVRELLEKIDYGYKFYRRPKHFISYIFRSISQKYRDKRRTVQI